MSNQQKANDIYNAMASRGIYRKEVIEQIVKALGVSQAYASTLYATAKKKSGQGSTSPSTSNTSSRSTITKFDRKNLRNLRADLENAVSAVAEKYGIALDFGSGRFSDFRYSVKLTCLIGSDGSTDHAKISWDLNCRMFGLKPEDFGRTFKQGSTRFTICGIKPKSRRYPIIAANDNGTEYKFPTSVLGINSINDYF